MVNRKERRLASKTAVNRRVKLDLLAEPSGDFGDSSNKEDVEGVGSSKTHADSPNSPSSSGQKQENPLLLLGQYTDEETEEESDKEISHDTRENSPSELDEQVKVDSHEGTVTEADKDKDENFPSEKSEEDNKEHPSSLDVPENGVIEDITVLPSHKDMDTVHAVEQTSVPWTSDPLTQTESTDSGWKMVLHEESNSYYYWNTLTGQTSWEVPVDFVDLVQGNGPEPKPQPVYDPQSVTVVEEMHVDTQPNDRSTESLPFEAMENDGYRPESDIMSHHGVKGDYVNTTDALSNGEGEAQYSDSYRLLEIGESLLERLKSLKVESQQKSKLMIELDIRLADIKSLVCYGSSLLPFWLHSENHLRKLETAINNEILEHSQFPNNGETAEKADNKIQEKENEKEKEKEVIVDADADADDDMDVEMEVEDDHDDDSLVQNGPHYEKEEGEIEVPIPPPPNDEWVPPPPPPPDDEQPPPPPPGDTTFVPPPPQAAGYTYGEEYNFAYAGPNIDYYGQQVQNHEYYVDATGCQLAAPIPTLYYTTVQNPYPDEWVPPPLPTCTTSTVTAPTEPVPKVQPKVARNKKRTVATVPGLRSNKKVSGLVDKWKAVKEELHEDEEDDEPENALEFLEKKKKREIEQWHAQQIATGEAKDNANFQPLGGDWRERVRRKRAKKSTEAEEHQTNPKGIDDINQKPDLVQLTKQLPSGWQAYWDEASKQVYYGNSKTSETSWTKPKV